MKNHFFTMQVNDQHFIFDYYNLLFIQMDEEIHNCLEHYLNHEEPVRSLDDIKKSSLEPIYEDISTLLENKLMISDINLSCEIMKNYKKAYFSFPTIHKCNLACKYCFAESGENYDGLNPVMDSSMIEQIYRFVLCYNDFQSCEQFRLDFVSGGEPLLNFDMIKEARRIGDTVFKEHGKSLDIWVCSNGILLNNEKAYYLNKHNIGLGVSLDGPKDVNDMFRVFSDNKSSYDQVLNHLSNIIHNTSYNNYFRDVWMLTVVTAQTKSLVEIMEHHKNLGVRNIQMKIVRSSEENNFALNHKNTEHFIGLYTELVDFLIRKVQEENDISYLKMILNGNDYMGKIIIRLILRDAAVYRCMAGRNKLSFAANGDIYPCDSFVGKAEFKLGNIFDGVDEKKVDAFYDMLIFNRSACKNCWANIICGGDCYYNSYLKNSDIKEPDRAFCVVNQKLCLLSIKLVAYLSFNKPELFERLYQYLTRRKVFQ
ncbi:MAG: radical SAM protein [Clostridia bacterium]|nr:radical SAM protein [Clostridia bacterium]